MQNITELRESLLNNYVALKAGKMNLGRGKELANTAGKILSSAKIELDYNQFLGNKHTIKFLEQAETYEPDIKEMVKEKK